MQRLDILIVDDDVLSRIMLERLVVQCGHNCFSANDGEAARDVLQSRDIDVCITDWEMPKASGLELCQWIKSGEEKKIPYVILNTSKNRPEDIQAAYEAGADDYITKPTDLKYLRLQLTRLAETIRTKEVFQETVAQLSPTDVYRWDLKYDFDKMRT
ncbi:MAG TPA: response regulator [Candidatus Angelobacter sp.]